MSASRTITLHPPTYPHPRIAGVPAGSIPWRYGNCRPLWTHHQRGRGGHPMADRGHLAHSAGASASGLLEALPIRDCAGGEDREERWQEEALKRRPDHNAECAHGTQEETEEAETEQEGGDHESCLTHHLL